MRTAIVIIIGTWLGIGATALGCGSQVVALRIGAFVIGKQAIQSSFSPKEFGLSTPHTLRAFSASDIAAGALDEFDVVIFPGGSAKEQSSSLGESGRQAIRDWVDRGGIYFGICAGGILASSGPGENRLGLLPVTLFNQAYWQRGRGIASLQLTEPYQEVVGSRLASADIYFFNGPLFVIPADAESEVYPLATYTSDIGEGTSHQGDMPGKLAAVAGRYGKGKVVLFSGHPETFVESRGWIEKTLQWARSNFGEPEI